MTRIGAAGETPIDQAERAARRDRERALDVGVGRGGDMMARDDRLGGDLSGSFADRDADRFDSNLFGRSQAFRERLGTHGGEGAAEVESAALQLSALIAASGRTMAAPVETAPPAAVTPAIPSERILAIAERAEKALAAELHLQAGRPVGVELDLGDAMPGVRGLKVELTGERMDVTLVRAAAGGEPDPALAAAAQALADRLQLRFQRRIVRILEIDPPDSGSASTAIGSGQAALSRLFAGGEGSK